MRGTDPAVLQPIQAPPRCTKCNSQPVCSNMVIGTLAADGFMLHLVQTRGAWVGWGPLPSPSLLYQMQQPTHQWPVYQSPYCYRGTLSALEALLLYKLTFTFYIYNGRLLCSFNVPIEGLKVGS